MESDKARLLARSRERAAESRSSLLSARRSSGGASWLVGIKSELANECAASHEG